jgi:hypothetical protein
MTQYAGVLVYMSSYLLDTTLVSEKYISLILEWLQDSIIWSRDSVRQLITSRVLIAPKH